MSPSTGLKQQDFGEKSLPSMKLADKHPFRAYKNPVLEFKGSTLRISIITVTFNSSATIKDTLESVRTQTHPNIEHIVIDGSSTDNTMEIVTSYPHIVRWISEKDNGLYDAMNKGIQLATGDIVGILNSDDIYSDSNVLSKVATAFAKDNSDSVYGDLEYVSSQNVNKVVRWWKSGGFKRSNFSFGWMPPHPTFFVKLKVYKKTGLFNLALKSAADYELMLRILFKYRHDAAYIPEVLVKMKAGGVSNGSLKKRLKANKEDRMAWRINDLHPYFFTLYLKPLRKVFQFINRKRINIVPSLGFNFPS